MMTNKDQKAIDQIFKKEKSEVDSLVCEKCGFPAVQYETEGLFSCHDCAEAHERRTNLRQAEKEFDEYQNDIKAE